MLTRFSNKILWLIVCRVLCTYVMHVNLVDNITNVLTQGNDKKLLINELEGKDFLFINIVYIHQPDIHFSTIIGIQ